MSSVDLDPITLAVIRAGLINGVAEMKAVVVRTAYSNLWKEAGDLSCGLLTGKGELVVQGIGDIPNHLATMPMSLAGCLNRIPAETLEPGDVLLQNDPYQGNNHLPDFIMAKPVFFEGKIVAYSAVRGHFVDIGGGGPGSYSTAMPDIYAEGLRIPPVKLYRKGQLNQDIIDVLTHNTRNSRERLGDLRSQYAGCITAERRVLAYCEKYGAATVTAAMDEMINASERLTRAAIREIPNGVYEFEDFCDNDGIVDEPIRIAVRVTVRDEEVEVDYTGSSPQVRGGMNSPLAVVVSAVGFAIKCLTDPENSPNSGSYRPIKVIAPPGSVVNPLPPSSVVAGNHETAARLVDCVFGALASAVPDRVCAAGAGSSGALSIGARVRTDGGERELIMVEMHGCGQGAHLRGDGINGRRVNIGNTGNTPSEALEASYPVEILAYGLREDGAGAGRTRGGTGLYRRLRLEHEAVVTITSERMKFRPYGLFGGLPAREARFFVELPDGTRQILNSKTPPLSFPAGTILHFEPSGGGGYGDPAERPLDKVQADLDDGYISVEAARDLYKVVVREDPGRAEGPHLVVGREGTVQ